MAQNGSDIEVAIVEVAGEDIVALMALIQMVISRFFPGESKNSISKKFFINKEKRKY